MAIGTKRVINSEDVGKCNAADAAEVNSDKIAELWAAEIEEHGADAANLNQVFFKFVGKRNLIKLGFLYCCNVVFAT